MKKLMFALAIASISSATFAQQSNKSQNAIVSDCLLYTSPSPRDA